jgi:hypothetical protein
MRTVKPSGDFLVKVVTGGHEAHARVSDVMKSAGMAQLATDAAGNGVGMTIPGRNGVMPIPQAAAASLKKWRTALGKVRNGTANAKLALMGDSTFAGSGSTGVAGFNSGFLTKSPGVQLASLMNSYFCPSVAHSVFGDSNIGAAFFSVDTRFTAGSGWVVAQIDNPWSRGIFGNSTTTNNLSFTPVGSVDTFRIWYITNSGSARSFNWSIDAGGTTNVDCNVASSLAYVDVPAGAAGTHTLNIARVAGPLYICAIQAWNSATKCVEVLSMGRSGGRALNATSSNAKPEDALNALPLYAPDLTVINLTINEWLNSGTTDAWKINMQQIIDVAKTTGDVVLMAGVPSKVNQAALAYQASFAVAAGELAAANGIPFLDVFGRFGSQESLAALYADDIHPNGSGYADMISPLYNLITQM